MRTPQLHCGASALNDRLAVPIGQPFGQRGFSPSLRPVAELAVALRRWISAPSCGSGEGFPCSRRPLRRANRRFAEVDLGSLLRNGRCENPFALKRERQRFGCRPILECSFHLGVDLGSLLRKRSLRKIVRRREHRYAGRGSRLAPASRPLGEPFRPLSRRPYPVNIRTPRRLTESGPAFKLRGV